MLQNSVMLGPRRRIKVFALKTLGPALDLSNAQKPGVAAPFVIPVLRGRDRF